MNTIRSKEGHGALSARGTAPGDWVTSSALLSAKGALLCGSLCLCAARPALSEERLFPADAGLINIQSPPFSARGDGVTDDTAAILAAIRFAIDRTVVTSMKPIVYFPSGTYQVSKTIESRLVNTNGYTFGWRHGMFLLGQNVADTVIRLVHHAPGFDDPAKPQALIRTASEEDPPGTRHADGSGATAFRHAIVNLTLDTGSGNPAAVGIDRYRRDCRIKIGDFLRKAS